MDLYDDYLTMKDLNNIQQEIIDDIIDEIFSRFEKDQLLQSFEYGKFKVYIYHSRVEIHHFFKYNFSNEYDSRKLYTIDHLDKIEPIMFWDSKLKKKKKKQHNRLYHLIKIREKLKERESQIESNKQWISWLPEEKQKQIYRSVKLERIIKEEDE